LKGTAANCTDDTPRERDGRKGSAILKGIVANLDGCKSDGLKQSATLKVKITNTA
jgi:hypothetical protein